MRFGKTFVIVLFIACVLSVVMQREALSEDSIVPAAQSVPGEIKDPVVPETGETGQPVQKTPVKSGSETTDLEKPCPRQDCPDVTPKKAKSARKKTSVRKWWTTGQDAEGHAASTGSAAKKKSPVKKSKSAKKKSADPGKATVEKKKNCSGPVVSLAAVKKELTGKKNLSGKNLSGMNLTGMNLVKANLSGACLEKTNLERADLAEADLERAELSGANLKRASLRLANINAVNFDGANLDSAIWPDSRICLEGSMGRCRDVIQ